MKLLHDVKFTHLVYQSSSKVIDLQLNKSDILTEKVKILSCIVNVSLFLCFVFKFLSFFLFCGGAYMKPKLMIFQIDLDSYYNKKGDNSILHWFVNRNYLPQSHMFDLTIIMSILGESGTDICAPGKFLLLKHVTCIL